MKKSMLILVFTALLSACGTYENEIQVTESAAEETTVSATNYVEYCTEISTQAVTEEIITTITTVSKNITEPITMVTDEIVTVQTSAISEESQKETETTVTTAIIEYAEIKAESVSVTEVTEQSTVPETTVTTTVTMVITEETESTKIQLSDYEKALEVYNFMTVNGSGTCVQYAYQTYEICCQYGLECYFVWTENQLYGHVANAVKIDGVWYVLDTQAGCFLTENMCGFTEIVDENENHIADADIISSVRYE